MNLCGLIPPCQNHTLFQTKKAKSITLFQTKTAPQPYPFGWHIPIQFICRSNPHPPPASTPSPGYKGAFLPFHYLSILLINIKHLIYSLINEKIHPTIVSCVYLVFSTIDTYLLFFFAFFIVSAILSRWDVSKRPFLPPFFTPPMYLYLFSALVT